MKHARQHPLKYSAEISFMEYWNLLHLTSCPYGLDNKLRDAVKLPCEQSNGARFCRLAIVCAKLLSVCIALVIGKAALAVDYSRYCKIEYPKTQLGLADTGTEPGPASPEAMPMHINESVIHRPCIGNSKSAVDLQSEVPFASLKNTS